MIPIYTTCSIPVHFPFTLSHHQLPWIPLSGHSLTVLEFPESMWTSQAGRLQGWEGYKVTIWTKYQDECSGTHNSSPSAWVMKVQIVTVCSSTPSQYFSSMITPTLFLFLHQENVCMTRDLLSVKEFPERMD